MKLLDFLINFLLSRERAQLPIDTLNIELASKVRDLLVPQLDHIQDSLIEAFRFTSNQILEMLLWLLVCRENFRKSLIIKLGGQ